jgi:hypothetical protein
MAGKNGAITFGLASRMKDTGMGTRESKPKTYLPVPIPLFSTGFQGFYTVCSSNPTDTGMETKESEPETHSPVPIPLS